MSRQTSNHPSVHPPIHTQNSTEIILAKKKIKISIYRFPFALRKFVNKKVELKGEMKIISEMWITFKVKFSFHLVRFRKCTRWVYEQAKQTDRDRQTKDNQTETVSAWNDLSEFATLADLCKLTDMSYYLSRIATSKKGCKLFSIFLKWWWYLINS